MKKTIHCEFSPPITLEEAKSIKVGSLDGVTFVIRGGATKIEAVKCTEESFSKLARELKSRKIAFVRKD